MTRGPLPKFRPPTLVQAKHTTAAARLLTMAQFHSHAPMKGWSLLPAATHSYTTEQLQQFNAAGVDPFVIQVAKLIGSQFSISLQGQRNLANVFSSLPQAEFYAQQMGIGFSHRHIARILSESDGGFAFLSILGCLGEYFAEPVIVALFQHIVKDLREDDIPEGYEPSDLQWKRLVSLCQGVLATSPFGTMVTRNHEMQSTGDNVSISQIAFALRDMSAASRNGSPKISLEHTGSDTFWFAAVAEYLFDLRVIVQDSTGRVLYKQPGVDATNAQVTIASGKPLFNDDSIDQWPLTRAFADIRDSRGIFYSIIPKVGVPPESRIVGTPVTGGRVRWDEVFRTSFGRTFTNMDPSLIAGFTGCAAVLLSSALEYHDTKTQEYFLPHASTIRGLSGYGLIETVTSWFPEIRRLAPQMGKMTKLSFQEARDKCDEISDIFQSTCMCSTCGNASSTSTEFCNHSVVEVILDLGLFIARTVVVPNLFPKRSGLIAFYDRLHTARVEYRSHRAPGTETFLKGFYAAFPTPRRMVETMCVLFTGSVPKDLTDTTLAISHEGITVSLTAWNPSSGARDPDNEQVIIRQRAGVNVSAGSSHLHGRISNRAYWVPFLQSGSEGADQQPLSFSESVELLRTKPKDVKQIVKPKASDLMLSYIRAGKSEEERAKRMGWLIL